MGMQKNLMKIMTSFSNKGKLNNIYQNTSLVLKNVSFNTERLKILNEWKTVISLNYIYPE